MNSVYNYDEQARQFPMQNSNSSSKMIESPTREIEKRRRETTCDWPRKVDVFGVQISVTDYDELVGCILDSALAGEPAVVSLEYPRSFAELITSTLKAHFCGFLGHVAGA